MKFKFAHNNLNVFNLEKSLKFYHEALDLKELRRQVADDGEFTLVYLGDGVRNGHLLELTWLRDMNRPYQMGDNEFHLAFKTDDFNAAYEKHRKMGCVCFENTKMGVYFINDPDGYWIEILPSETKLQSKSK